MFETDTFMALSTARDPDVELRMFKTRNPRVKGFAFFLYGQNEVFARRVVAQVLKTLAERGVRVDGRWVGITVAKLQDELATTARVLGCPLLTPAERLQRGHDKVEQTARRAAGLSGGQRP